MGRYLGAIALLGLGVQACSPDASAPLSPEPGDASLNTGTPPAWRVTKTAIPSWDRTVSWDWDVAKTVSPTGMVLNQGQSGTFNFTITATRSEAGSSSSYGMSGEVCVTNNSGAPTVNLRVEDRIFEFVSGTPARAVADILVDVSEKPEIENGESHCYPYSIEMAPDFAPNPGSTYKNAAYVNTIQTIDGAPKMVRVVQTAVDFVWPTTPTSSTEEDETATVVDLVSCPEGFTCTPSSGQWTFGSTSSQPLGVLVTNVSATCSSEFTVLNTATLTEGDSGAQDQAQASGLVNTQECAPPPAIHGCTPGYWKQKHHFDSWVGFTPTQDYDAVFGVNLFNPNKTLVQALSTGGGKQYRMGRHSVAALLNTANAGVQYGMTTAQVIAIVQQAVATGNYDWASDQFEKLNEKGCPLN